MNHPKLTKEQKKLNRDSRDKKEQEIYRTHYDHQAKTGTPTKAERHIRAVRWRGIKKAFKLVDLALRVRLMREGL